MDLAINLLRLYPLPQTQREIEDWLPEQVSAFIRPFGYEWDAEEWEFRYTPPTAPILLDTVRVYDPATADQPEIDILFGLFWTRKPGPAGEHYYVGLATNPPQSYWVPDDAVRQVWPPAVERSMSR